MTIDRQCATTIQKAEESFDHYDDPLDPTNPQHRHYFVSRAQYREAIPADFLHVLDEWLDRPEPDKPIFLFTGNTGSGKSTELRWRCSEPDITARFEVLLVDGVDDFERNNELGAPGILIYIAQRALARAAEYRELAQLLKEPQLARQLDQPLKQLDTSGGVKLESVEVALKLVALDVKAKLNAKKEMSLFPKGEADRPREIAAAALTTLSELADREVLLVVDDCEKFWSRGMLEEVFLPALPRLLGLIQPARGRRSWGRLVQSFPYRLNFDPEFRSRYLDKRPYCIVPNIKLTNALTDGRPFEPGRVLLRQAVLNRVDERCLTPEALEALVEISGGHMRSLMRLGYEVFRFARWQGKTNVLTKEQVIEGKNGLGSELFRIFSNTDIGGLGSVEDFLRRRNLGGAVTSLINEKEQNLLIYGIIMDYQNRAPWYALHPTLEDLLPPGFGEPNEVQRRPRDRSRGLGRGSTHLERREAGGSLRLRDPAHL
jgi:hypothetical protein